MIQYKFVGMGEQVKIENDNIILRNIEPLKIGSCFVCDVGNKLENGIIDHHTALKENECATLLVYDEPEKYVKNIQNKTISDYTIITHGDPDFDAIGSTWLVTKLIENKPIPKVFKKIADYILDVDLGRIQLDENKIITPFSMILGINFLINEKYSKSINETPIPQKFSVIEEKNRQILLKSYDLVEYIITSLESGTEIHSNDLFNNLKGFEAEIELLNKDFEKYQKDFKRSFTAKLKIINKLTEEKEEIDFISTEYPESVLWKYWVRGDKKHTNDGFIFTCAFFDTYKSKEKSRAIIAIDRTSDYYLKGLGLAIEEAEIKKLLQNEKYTNKTEYLEVTLSDKKRDKFHRNDPWFDERNDFTIIDGPREGSVLTNNEILRIVLGIDYWLMLSKTLTDEKGSFYTDMRVLFPELYSDITRPREQKYDEFTGFISNLENGIYNNTESKNIIESISKDLYCENSEVCNTGIDKLEVFLLILSKIPQKTRFYIKWYESFKNDIFELIIKTMDLYGEDTSDKRQERLFRILELNYTPEIVRESFGRFKISERLPFAKLFFYGCNKLSKEAFFEYSNRLITKNLSKDLFSTLTGQISKATENPDKEFRIKVLNLCATTIEFKKNNDFLHPISSFDDYKDTVDDLLMFSLENEKLSQNHKDFILNDSEYFASFSMNLDKYNRFLQNYLNIKRDHLLKDDFYKEMIYKKGDVEFELNKYQQFNILRKYTETTIRECSLSSFTKLKNIINKANFIKSGLIDEKFKSSLDYLEVIKTFENLLHRLKIIAINNEYLSQFKNEADETKSSALFYFSFIRLLNDILFNLIKSQYIPDKMDMISAFEKLLQYFDILITGSDRVTTAGEKDLFLNIREVFDKMLEKNSIPVSEYNKKISILSSIISIIGSDKTGLIRKVDENLIEPLKSTFIEILNTIKVQLSHEFEFLVKNLKKNIENDNPEVREYLKNILVEIVNEATRDELRKQKQSVDKFSDERIVKDFYKYVIIPYRSLSYSTFIEPDLRTNELEKKKFMEMSKKIRKYFSGKGKEYDPQSIAGEIGDLKKKTKDIITKKSVQEMTILSQLQSSNISKMTESFNLEIYEYLIKFFLDRYCIDDAQEKIEEYSISRPARFAKIISSGWIGALTLPVILISILTLYFSQNDILSYFMGAILTITTFSPLALVVGFLLKLLYDNVKKVFHKREKIKTKSKAGTFQNLSVFGKSKINQLIRNLLFVEFLVPLTLGIIAVSQGNDSLGMVLKLDGYRLLIFLPLLFIMSYYSLFSEVIKNNSSYTFQTLNKITLKVYLFLFTQAWIMTLVLLNLISKYILDFDPVKISEFSGIYLNFLGLDYNIFPVGTITITFVGLFVGLFVESFLGKNKAG